MHPFAARLHRSNSDIEYGQVWSLHYQRSHSPHSAIQRCIAVPEITPSFHWSTPAYLSARYQCPPHTSPGTAPPLGTLPPVRGTAHAHSPPPLHTHTPTAQREKPSPRAPRCLFAPGRQMRTAAAPIGPARRPTDANGARC